MDEFQITCVRRDPNDITTEVGIGFSQNILPVSKVIADIRNNTALYYTYENRSLARVHARQRSDTGTWFLTTSPDESAPNNLDIITVCPE
jgi:Protein of unknown function (DUF3892)